MLTCVVAAAENHVIGQNGQLPWHLPADLRRFKHLTQGHVVLMGRKTYQSIGRPLPNRINLVVSRQPDFTAPGIRVFSAPSEALAYARQLGNPAEIFVIGGAEIYRQLLPFADRVVLTRVHTSLAGDAFFPELQPADWHEVAREEYPADDKHAYAFTLLDLRRNKPGPA